MHGSAGPGVAENMMSGEVIVKGDASQYAGATGQGGLLVIEGNASSRCGISMKGIDIVVKGNIGHMSAFMAQAGQSGRAAETPAMRSATRSTKRGSSCAARSRASAPTASRRRCGPSMSRSDAASGRGRASRMSKPGEFKRYGSARKLYNFNVDNADAYG